MIGMGTMSRIEGAHPRTGPIARSGRQGLGMANAAMPGIVGLGVIDEVQKRYKSAIKKGVKR